MATTTARDDRTPAAALLGELSGAVADLGTFLPLVIGVLAVGGFDAAGVLTGFGLFALAVAVFYRRPVPVQPMKAVSALAIVGALSAGQAMATGIVLGLVLLVLAATGAIGRLARVLPESVILGIQAGVGLHLALLGARHVAEGAAFGVPGLVALVLLSITPLRSFAALAVVAAATAVALGTGGAVAWPAPGLHLPLPAWPALADFRDATLTAVVPQLALTVTNAVLATAAIAGDFFPADRARLGAGRLAASTGVLNLALAPLGALPMCHGAGGLVAQHRFGARSWGAPAVFGALCLVLGLGFGDGARTLLALVPLGAVGALLLVAGAEMAAGRKVLALDGPGRAVALVTALTCVGVNVAAGLVAGLVLELARRAWMRRRG
ncbi:MAG: sulfate transporter [Hyphomicrobiales bacterium]|nr:sulfate transporter [Hyphomicrobiales bacterium]